MVRFQSWCKNFRCGSLKVAGSNPGVEFSFSFELLSCTLIAFTQAVNRKNVPVLIVT